MFRLFIGIPLPDDIRKILGNLRGGLPGARWVSEESLHLTLRFVGEVGQDDAEDLHQELTRVRATGFSLTLTGLGCFETGNKVRALWAGVTREERLIHLQDRIEAAVVRAGREPERRKFKAHVTLARFKNGTPARVGSFMEMHNDLAAGPFDVSHFTLFRSFLGREGAHYEALADYPLGVDETAVASH